MSAEADRYARAGVDTEADRVTIRVDGAPLAAAAGVSVAVALLNGRIDRFRRSVTGEPRAPLCGMGTCFECRLTIDGRPHQKSCQVLVTPGMEILTDAGTSDQATSDQVDTGRKGVTDV